MTILRLGRGQKSHGQIPRRQKPKVFNTLFLGKNELKQRNYIRTKQRLEELNKRENLIQKR